MKTRQTRLLTLAAAAGVLAGCQTTDPALVARVDALETELAAVKAAQQKIVTHKHERAGGRMDTQLAAYKIPQGESPIMGPVDAPVTVTVFGDFQCPFCARAHPLFKALVEDPTLAGKVRVMYKHFPLSFHKNARPAAYAAIAAQRQGDDKFWAMADLMYANYQALTPENFLLWAAESGLDVEQFRVDMADHAAHDARIAAEMKMGQMAAKVRGTPSIYVNGWILKTRSVDGVKKLITEHNLLGTP